MVILAFVVSTTEPSSLALKMKFNICSHILNICLPFHHHHHHALQIKHMLCLINKAFATPFACKLYGVHVPLHDEVSVMVLAYVFAIMILSLGICYLVVSFCTCIVVS